MTSGISKACCIAISSCLFFICTETSAQTPGKTKIIEKHFHECVYYKDEETNDSSVSEDIHVTYPFIITANKKINSLINTTVQKRTGVYRKMNMPPCEWDTSDYYNKPGEINRTYKINITNQNLLSLTISEDAQAGGGGSGAAQKYYPLTFDLASGKVYRLRDIITPQYQKKVYSLIKNKFKEERYEAGYYNYNEEEDMELKNIHEILDHNVSVSSKGIMVYWAFFVHGCCIRDYEAFLSFKTYRNYFNESFLKKLATK